MKKEGILLLGGTGFVGRALAASFVKNGFTKIYSIAKNRYQWKRLTEVQAYESSLDNHILLKKILPNCRIVFHLASDTTPGWSALKPSVEADSNLLPTLRFLEVLQDYPRTLLIYVSSGGAIYGNSEQDPITEDMPLSPLSYYGAGKAALEKFILAFCRQTNGNAMILRPSNIYGPGQPYKSGFGVIPTLFHHLITEQPLQIWGDGKAVRDYVFINDFVRLNVNLVKSRAMTVKIPIYNVGSGRGYTINELCDLVENVSGRKLIREYRPARVIDVKRVILNSSQIEQDFDWKASTNLRIGLERTWEWFRHRTV